MFQKIPGPALCGFADLFEGVGYTARQMELMGAGGGRVSRPAVVKAGLTAAKPIAASLHKTLAAHKAAAHRVAKTATALHKAIVKRNVVLGAGPAKVLTPAQKTALARYNTAVSRAKSANAKARQSLGKAIHAFNAHGDHMKGTAGAHVALQKKRIVMVGGFTGVIGADPDPNYPGFLTDGTPDPNWSADQPSNAPPDPSHPGFLTDGSPDPNWVPASDQQTQQVATIPQSTPLPLDQAPKKVNDGIKYDGSKGWPKNQFGSQQYFDSHGVWGYVWGWDKFPHGVFVDTDTARWVCVGGNNGMSANGLNWWDVQTADPSAAADTSKIADLSRAGQIPGGKSAGSPKGTFGPLIGAPSGDFKNLRWATDDQAWFWYPSEAPDWATIDIRNQAAAAAQAIADAKAAADAAAADAAAKLKADQDAQQAAADFQAQLAQSQANADANVRQTAAEQAQAESDAQQAAAQAQADIEASKQQAAQDAAQADLDRQEQQLELDRQRAEIAAASRRAASAPIDTTATEDGGGYSPEDDSTAEANAADAATVDDALDDGGDQVIGADGQPIALDEWGNLD